MTKFYKTEAADEFVASASSRETSTEVMEAIAFFARNKTEAEKLWEGTGLGEVANLSDVWERATGNGRVDDKNLFWGGRTLAAIMAECALFPRSRYNLKKTIEQDARWFRIVGAGGHSGPIKQSRDEAYEAWVRAMQRIGYGAWELATANAVGNCVMIKATTRRAAESAGVSAVSGKEGNGKWWRE